MCFKSDLVLPKLVLDRASEGAINIHPAPPRYRGIGGYTYALFHGDREYGVTAHHMIEKLDYGRIIRTISFPIYAVDTPSSLRTRAAVYCLALFHEIVDLVIGGLPLPESGEQWTSRLHTRSELESFMRGLTTHHGTARCIE